MSAEEISCKVVLIGEMNVGKTSIISRYIKGIFDKNIFPTIDASYLKKKVYFKKYNKFIQFVIWDTAGQENFRSLNKFFYRDALIIIFVYDITNKKSFIEIKDFWYNEIKNNGINNQIFAIAGNKCDKYEEEEINENIVNEYAKSINAIFMRTSAYTNFGIDELFFKVGESFLNQENFYSPIKLDKTISLIQNESSDKISINDDKTNIKKKQCC